MNKADTNRILVIILLFTTIYSLLRYNVLGDVPFSDIPTFIINKSVAFTLVIILLVIFYYKLKKKRFNFEFMIKGLNAMAVIHILLSITLLTQEYYPKLFDDHKLTLFGNLSVLFGVVTVAYVYISKHKVNNLIVYAFISFHLFFLGVKGWFNIDMWNNFLPPITLICFLILIFLITLTLIKLLKRNKV